MRRRVCYLLFGALRCLAGCSKRFHDIWQNLSVWIEKLDFEEIRTR